MRNLVFVLIAIIFLPGVATWVHASGQTKYFILICWDGMRPDYVSAELTPTLHALREQGVWFANHHSAYPTSTEVNGAVLSTGVFPQRNGILANREYRPEINPLQQIGTEAFAAVRRGDELSGGKYIRVPTVAELVQKKGGRTAVVGAKPVALLHDRLARPADSQNPVWFAGATLPENLCEGLTNQLGGFPPTSSPNTGRDTWATRCLLDFFWKDKLPGYSVLWLSEPDYSQHHHGPGSPEALAGIKNADDRLAAVLAELDRRGVREQTDILVVSDHGFSTVGQNGDVAATLRRAGLNAQSVWTTPPQTNDIMVVGNGGSVLVYVVGKSPETIQRVVTALQQESTSGVLFTRTGVPGTFPLSEVKLDAPTAADVIVASSWKINGISAGPMRVEITNEGNTEYRAGDGMHVTLSPTDLHNLAVAFGPDFKRGVISPIPSGNVDVVPTLLWLMGIRPPQPLDGRILSEALTISGPAVSGVELGRRDAVVKMESGVWRQQLKFTEVNGVRYLEEGNGSWETAISQGGKK